MCAAVAGSSRDYLNTNRDKAFDHEITESRDGVANNVGIGSQQKRKGDMSNNIDMSDIVSEENIQLATKLEEMEYQMHKMETELKKYKDCSREQKLFCKHIGEYLFHKFGFNIWLRLEMAKNSGDTEVSDGEDDNSSECGSPNKQRKNSIPIPKSIPRPVPQKAMDKSQSISMGQRLVTPASSSSSRQQGSQPRRDQNQDAADTQKNVVYSKGRNQSYAGNYKMYKQPQATNSKNMTETIPVVLTAVPRTSSKTVLISAIPAQGGQSEQLNLVRSVETLDPILNPPPSIKALPRKKNKRKASEVTAASAPGPGPGPTPSTSTKSTWDAADSSLTHDDSPAKLSKSIVKPCSVVIETQPQLEKLFEPSLTTDSVSASGPSDEGIQQISDPEEQSYPQQMLITGDVSPPVFNPSLSELGPDRQTVAISTTGTTGLGFKYEPIIQQDQVQEQEQESASERFTLRSEEEEVTLSDPLGDPLLLPSRRKFMTTKDQTVVEIVEDFNAHDPNIDIKYESQFIEDDPEMIGIGIGGGPGPSTSMSTMINDGSLLSDGSKPPPVRDVERRVISLKYRQSSTFDVNWLYQMKKFQGNLIPYQMFIKRDEFRQWFEYLPNVNPELSRFRCRLCYKYLQTYGIPRSYWGPVESEQGQLKKTECDNRNAINAHARKKSHLEVMRKLQMEGNADAGFVDVYDKNTKKQLIESISKSGDV